MNILSAYSHPRGVLVSIEEAVYESIGVQTDPPRTCANPYCAYIIIHLSVRMLQLLILRKTSKLAASGCAHVCVNSMLPRKSWRARALR